MVSQTRPCGPAALFFAAAMDVCRLWAILPILFLVPGLPPFPFAGTACTLAVGALAGRGLSRVRKRRITGLLFYAAFCLVFIFVFAGSRSGLSFWFVSCSIALFWLRGVRLGAGQLSHSLTVNRYDIGAGIFFCAYFLRMGLRAPDPLAPRLMGAYFLFSILALFFSRRLDSDKAFIRSRSSLSLLVPFVAAVFLAGGALVLLYPFLAHTAAELYAFAWDNSGPLRDLLVLIVRFLFGSSRRGPAGEAAASVQAEDDFSAMEEVSPPGGAEKILLWVFIVIAAALALVLAVWLVVALARYLAGRAGAGEEKPGLLAALREFFARMARRLRGVSERLRRVFARMHPGRRLPHGAGQEAFRRLCAWGRTSGLPRRASETPGEYAKRLSVRFPSLRKAALDLVHALEEELYGGRPPGAAARARLNKAHRSLKNPALIPARLSCRLGIGREAGTHEHARTATHTEKS